VAGSSIIQIGASALFEIDDNLETVEQDVLLELVQHVRGVNAISFFAPSRAALRRERRLG
jgi:hypothetical protein